MTSLAESPKIPHEDEFEEWAKGYDISLVKWHSPAKGFPYCSGDTQLAYDAFCAGLNFTRLN